MSTNLSRSLRPRQRGDLVAFPVANEMVLLPSGQDLAYALNQSGRAIWKLCDGLHTPADMLRELRTLYAGDDVEVMTDLSAALLQLQNLGLVETTTPTLAGQEDATAIAIAPAADTTRPRVRFVYGAEDRAYFHWQLAILFESMVGQLPAGWDIIVVVCNDHAPLSPELLHLLDTYGIQHVTGSSHAKSHAIDFSESKSGYVALNRVEALNAVGDYVEADDVVCLMDTDIFLYGELQEELFPRGNAMAANWIIGEERFFAFSGDGRGVDLQKLLEALGCSTPLKPGGVTVFLTGETVRNKKVIRDCFRFAQILYLLGKVADLPDRGVWVSEMACFAMSLTPNGIDYELLDIPQFSVLDARPERLPEGSFYHYYTDVNDGGGGPFVGSEWHKQLFQDRNFLLEDLESFEANAQGDVERRFLELAQGARRRLYSDAVGSPRA